MWIVLVNWPEGGPAVYGPFTTKHAADAADTKMEADGRHEVDDADGNNITTYTVLKVNPV